MMSAPTPRGLITAVTLLALALLPVCGAAASNYVITDVTVIPMDEERTLPDRNVVIRDGYIKEIYAGFATELPDRARVIDGRGLYLMPGLSDMHTHVWHERDLELFVANGVTTIRIMSGGPGYLGIRRRINQGKLVGPTVYTAGPFVDGPEPVWPLSDVVANAGQARSVVESQWGRGYDFIKVYDGLSPDAYRAIMRAAEHHGIPVAGHVPRRVDLATALRLKQRSIEHLSGYGRALRSFDKNFRALSQGPLTARERGRMRYLAVQTRAAGVWNCPTLVVYQRWRKGAVSAEFKKQRGIEYVSPSMLAAWQPGHSYVDNFSDHEVASVRAGENARQEMVRALFRAGAKLLLGTDTPNPWVVPGFSVHEELHNFLQVGLTPYQALKVATRDAAEFLGRSDAGTVAAGKRADLVLLGGNPLKDVNNLKDIRGVMLGERWLPHEVLSQMLTKRKQDFEHELK